MKDKSNTELKAAAFEIAHQINLLKRKQREVIEELTKRNAIPKDVEVTLDDSEDEVRDTDT